MTLSPRNAQHSTSSARRMSCIALMSALICAVAPISIPIGPVPISMATLIIYLSAYILGGRMTAASCLIYLLIGLLGIPVFSGFTSGPGCLFGPTGGYLFGYLFLAVISGFFISRCHGSRLMAAAGMVLGTAALYFLGTCWLALQAHLSIPAALAAGVIPFLPGDALKIILVLAIGPSIASRLRPFL